MNLTAPCLSKVNQTIISKFCIMLTVVIYVTPLVSSGGTAGRAKGLRFTGLGYESWLGTIV